MCLHLIPYLNELYFNLLKFTIEKVNSKPDVMTYTYNPTTCELEQEVQEV